jgi:hypothetical protein
LKLFILIGLNVFDIGWLLFEIMAAALPSANKLFDMM